MMLQFPCEHLIYWPVKSWYFAGLCFGRLWAVGKSWSREAGSIVVYCLESQLSCYNVREDAVAYAGPFAEADVFWYGNISRKRYVKRRQEYAFERIFPVRILDLSDTDPVHVHCP